MGGWGGLCDELEEPVPMIARFTSSRTWWTAAVLLTAVAATAQAAEPSEPAAATETPAAVSYYRDVRPILQANCQGCHQPAKAGGSLEMTAHASLLAAGESGSLAIVPGKPDESYLIEQITPADGEAAMPQGK